MDRLESLICRRVEYVMAARRSITYDTGVLLTVKEI